MIVRSWVRKRFLASCWLIVEPPCATALMQNVGDECTSDAERIDAVMLVEAPILDGDECLRHIARHFLQGQRFAGEIAASGERAPLHVHDLDRGRTFGNFQRLDRRQVRANPGHHADAADREPQTDDQAPVCDSADQGPLVAGRAFLAHAPLARFRPGSVFVVGRGPFVGGDMQIRAAVVERRLPACVRCSLFRRHHATRPAPAHTSAGPQKHAKRVDLRGR